MANLTRYLSALFVLLLIGSIPQVLQADSPPINQPITITDMVILPIGGDSILFKVKYTPHLTDSGNLRLYFPKHIAPFNQAQNELYRDVSMSYTANVNDSISFLLEEKSLGSSMLQVCMEIANPPTGFNRSTTRFVEIEHSTGQMRMLTDATFQTQDTAFFTKEGQSPQSTSLNISGRVIYDDHYQAPYKGVAIRGVYKVRVSLFFIKEGITNPVLLNTQLFHPFNGYDQHVHYDICDINGNFSFNFTGPSTWSQYQKIVILVSKYNESATMFSGGSGYILAEGTTGTPVTVNADLGYFHFSVAQGAEFSVNNPNSINYSDVQIMVNTPDGGILRNMQLSQEYNIDRFGGNIPYAVPKIAVDRKVNLLHNGVHVAGLFTCNAEFWPFISAKRHVEIDNDHYDLSTISHEYGHYVNYRLWDVLVRK